MGVHDIFFKDIFVNTAFAAELFHKVLTPKEFAYFNWKTLRVEGTVYINKARKEKRADLLFSVKTKRGKKATDLLLLLEHKTGTGDGSILQLLEYQSAIYAKRKNPILPVLLYQGPEKTWKKPRSFQDSLEGMTPFIGEHFGGKILNFGYGLLNLQSIAGWENGLTTDPIFYIMANIWRMNRHTLARFTKLCEGIEDKKLRRALLEKGLDYVHNFDKKKFPIALLKEVERENLNKGDWIMAALSSSLERERLKGEKKGKKEGEIKKAQEIALNSLRKGVDIATISEITGLTEEQIRELDSKKAA